MQINKPIPIDGEEEIEIDPDKIDPALKKAKRFLENLSNDAKAYKDLQLGIIGEPEKV